MEKLTKQEIETKVKTIINKIRPYLLRDGGDIEFLRIENGIVYVRMMGACVGCANIDVTLKDGIEAILLEEVPGIFGVENVYE
ncbi:MAG TPA: NifU family protein [Bacilli bacterium]|nr:MAG: Fe/S biogenesis protein NfuA [Tenericutes bacterium ADurb.BinA124]HNZ50390.1 NifU family protein [Bacilli bacterium]HOH17830.1 NifU family protein [Bacilli bacterium]HPX83797.1 NifU family protein [Bacilli bacterium]HQC73900.1 NifU family protein [Bacilli bacterium]